MADRLDFHQDKPIDIRMIELLLRYGADMKLIDKEGETPSVFLIDISDILLMTLLKIIMRASCN